MQEDGVWRTINGAKVFIKNGQSVMDAFVRQKANKQKQDKPSQEQIDKDITNIVNTGQVFEFSIGPQMTLCSRYENGDYTWGHQSQDEPMWRFEEAIVPELKDEFVVIDRHYGKVPRTSRFKKYGYEVVGETKERKKNIGEGIYDNESVDYGDETWYLMRKKGANK